MHVCICARAVGAESAKRARIVPDSLQWGPFRPSEEHRAYCFWAQPTNVEAVATILATGRVPTTPLMVSGDMDKAVSVALGLLK